MVFLKRMAAPSEWSGGTIHDPENGRTYTAYMCPDGNDALRMRGYVTGMRFPCHPAGWIRERKQREKRCMYRPFLEVSSCVGL
jgi:uncharacterized protein (DUF2147 family)